MFGRKFFENYESGRVVTLLATATLKARDNVVMVDTSAGEVTLTLPPVSECAGLFFSISLIAGETTSCNVQDQDDSRDWNGDYDLNATADRILLYSDGTHWWDLDNQIA